MPLDAMFEDLETEFDSLCRQSPPSLESIGLLKVHTHTRSLTLCQLVFCKDFLFGLDPGKTALFALPYRGITLLEPSAGQSKSSSLSFSSWLDRLPESTWLRCTTPTEVAAGRILRLSNQLLQLGQNIYPISCFEAVELRFVDN